MDQTLTAETGRTAGSRSSSRLRAEGQVPCVVYGLGRDAVAVSVPWPDLRRALSTEAGTNALITIDVDGQRDLTIVKDLQRDPVKRNVLHVDFLRVDPDAPVSVDVPILLIGEAREVENRRGVVDQPLKSLTVNAKPADIPSSLEVNIEDLDVGITITVSEIALPAGVTTDVDPDSPVVGGVPTRFTAQLDHGVDPADLDDGEGGGSGEAPEAEAAEAAEADTE